MKHKVLLICMLLCFIYKVMGQDSLYRHRDISVGFGLLPVPSYFVGRGPIPVSFSAQYTYQWSKIVGLCVIASYSPVKSGEWEEERLLYVDERDRPHYECITHENKTIGAYISIMPAIQANWVYKRSFTLYSKAAVGLSHDTDEAKIDYAVQFSPLGITFGRKTYGMFELGIGRQGFLVFGMGYKFR